MPVYIYKNPETGEVKEVFQSVSDLHEYFEGGLKWERVFTVPNMSVDSKTPQTKEEFMDVTSRKKGTIGDMQDLSKQMSEDRAKVMGEDPVKKKYFEEYSKKRRGRKHQMDKKPIEKKGIKVHFD